MGKTIVRITTVTTKDHVFIEASSMLKALKELKVYLVQPNLNKNL